MKKIKAKYVLIAVAGICIFIYLFSRSGDEEIKQIKRPGYNSQAEPHQLVIRQDGVETEIEVMVEPMDIPGEKLQEAFDDAYEKLCEAIIGNNERLDCITEKLNMVSTIGEYGIKVDYFTDKIEIVDVFGNVNNKGLESNVDVRIYADFTYKNMLQRYEIPITVVPVPLTEMEKLNEEINNIVNNQSENEEYVKLPESIDGKEIAFVKKGSGPGVILLLIAVVIVALVYNKKVGKTKKYTESRKKQMMSDYSEIVSKLSLLMGAGMSSYNALSKMVADYKILKCENKLSERFAYEELGVCVNKIASGYSETDAYKELGKRCEIHSYVKLCSFLSQNINKGNSNIFDLLKEETKEAFEERKAIARKNGEEAGTKLLGPMVMMLSVVLVIVIIPAFMSL